MAIRESSEATQKLRRKPLRQVKVQAKPDPSPTAAEHLDYIADMVQQLRAMAAASEQWTLAALLDLAGHEAMRQPRPSRKATSRRG